MSVGSLPQIPGYLIHSGFRRWSVDEYHRLIDTGFLAEGDPIQLLEGNMVLKMPPNPPHSNTVSNILASLPRHLPSGWRIRSEQPITLADSEPQPDITLARGDQTTYRSRHPSPPDIGLVVEVADTSPNVDRSDMGRIYARANLPVYWVINLLDCQIEVYTDPRPSDSIPAYATRTDYRPGDAVPLILDGQQVARLPVDELLG
jgi:Uma2 family endonuclease